MTKRDWKSWKTIARAVVSLKKHEGWGEGDGQVALEEVREGVEKTLDNQATDGKFLGLLIGRGCEVCHQRFAGLKQLLSHYRDEHPEFFRDSGPPRGPDAL